MSMAHTTETVDGSLLWLCPAASSGRSATGKIAAIEQSLVASARPVQTVHSVYHAMLHLIRGSTKSYKAAIICVDGIEHAELEFFTILAQQNACPPVYAYGHERSLPKLGKAVELGATGEATLDLVQQLVAIEVAPQPPSTPDIKDPEPTTLERQLLAATPKPEPDTTEPEPDETAPAITDDVADQTPPPPTRQPDETEPTIADAERADTADETETPVRVPWRNDDTTARRAPRRQPPPQRTPPAANESGAEQDNASQYEPGPLLTEDELRALIGDDDTTGNTDTHRT